MPFMKKTYSQKPADTDRKWFLIDASEAPLGKTAVLIANKLMGKNKVTFTPHVDNGDYVVVINSKSVVTTGNKEVDKMYYHHSGYQGGLRELRLEEVREKQPERIIINAVKGMMPKNKLADERLKRLKIFEGAEHAHTAQTPEKVEVK
jgi:ribosomal protein L13, bacterial type